MKEIIWSEVIKYIVPPLLSFILGFLFNQYRAFKGYLFIIKWATRKMLIEDAKFYLEQGYLTPKESADFENLWKIYNKKLKLNTEGEAYYNLVKKLPVRLNNNESSGNN